MGDLRTFISDEQGSAAPLFAVALVGLVAMGGLAYDVSRGFALRAELDGAVDAAALAGATQLDGQAGARDRATNAARGAFVQNGQKLGNTSETNVATGSGATITFLSAIYPSHVAATSDSDAHFIQVDLAPRPMNVLFGGFVRRTAAFQARAHAVAGYGSAICKVPPLMICNPDEPVGNTDPALPFNGNSHIGKGMIIKGSGSSGAWGPGDFGYLSVGGNTNAIKDAMARNPPLAECFGATANTQPGNNASILDYFNVRFDMVANGLDPDLKTDPHYAPAQVTITGLPKTTSGGTLCVPKPDATVYDGSNGATVSSMPLPRDTCAYAAGGATCAGAPNSLGNGIWDKASYFAVNHGLPAPNATNAPTGEAWTTFGPAPSVGTQPTRFQVYKWEIAHRDDAGFWRNSKGATTGNNDDFAKPRCSANDVPSTPDRRTISAIVVNCRQQNVHGSMPVTIAGGVDLLLTEPASNTGSDMFIYGEIIGTTTNISEVGKQTLVYSVRLYE
jgi:Flp pilus assembly protein TadG